MCREGIASADPMMVWGRVNLHMTDRKEERDFVASPVLLFKFPEADDDMDSASRKTLILLRLCSKFRVDDDA